MTHADPAMKAYYADRAREYERIFAKPERQTDLRILEERIPAALSGLNGMDGGEVSGVRYARHIGVS